MAADDDLKRALREAIKAGLDIQEVVAEAAQELAAEGEAIGAALLEWLEPAPSKRLPRRRQVPSKKYPPEEGWNIVGPGTVKRSKPKPKKRKRPVPRKRPRKYEVIHVAGTPDLYTWAHSVYRGSYDDLADARAYVRPIPRSKYEIIHIQEVAATRSRKEWKSLSEPYRKRLVSAGKRYGMNENDVMMTWRTDPDMLARLRGHKPKIRASYYEVWTAERDDDGAPIVTRGMEIAP